MYTWKETKFFFQEEIPMGRVFHHACVFPLLQLMSITFICACYNDLVPLR